MGTDAIILSVCTSCRDGQEASGKARAGTLLARKIANRWHDRKCSGLELRGVQCMSQCKRPCVVSLSGSRNFSYIFGDISLNDPIQIEALFDLVDLYGAVPEGYMERSKRPEHFKSNILGRIPPNNSISQIIKPLEPMPIVS